MVVFDLALPRGVGGRPLGDGDLDTGAEMLPVKMLILNVLLKGLPTLVYL